MADHRRVSPASQAPTHTRRKRLRRRADMGFHRRLAVERLEDRRLLTSVAPLAISPGVGININNLNDYSPDLLFANAMMTSRHWGSTSAPYDLSATVDAQGWPTEDAGVVVTDPTGGDVGGTYALSFTGQAASVSGVLSGNVQVLNKQYNSSTNTTTATIVVPAGQSQLYLSFTGTQRLATSAVDTGITNVVLMRPTVTDGSTPYPAGTLFTSNMETLLSNFQVIRFMDYSNTNNNTQVNWSDRTLPTAATQQASNGGAWEYAVALANATDKDMWINIPEGATPAYVTDLADLIKYGSDGVNPYTSPQANPVYAPLNPNLKVYFEYSNEVWDLGVNQGTANESAAVAEANAGNSPLNYDGTTDAYTLAIRRIVEQTVDDSNIFRSVFGSAAMMSQIRPVYEFQYNNLSDTAQTGLDFLNGYYNNADGQQHVTTPEPPDYYLWGAGGAWYYTVNDASGDGDVSVANSSFETPSSSSIQTDPTGASWNFSGTAGIVPNGSGLDNAAAPDGTQAAYLQGTGSFSQSVTFSGGYADITFNASRAAAGNDPLQVLDDGTAIGPFSFANTFFPGSTSYVTELTLPFETTPGTHTITFVGQAGSGTSFVDHVQVQTVNGMYNSGIQNISSLVATESQWATAYGLQMVSDEGGFHVGGDGPTPLQVLANLDPRAQAAEASGIAEFFQNGGALAMFYNTTNLSYELTGDLDDLNTPKLLAIYAATSAGLPVPTIATTLPATLGHSVTISEVSAADFVLGSTTNASTYLVQATGPGTFSVQIQGSQASQSATEHFMVDGQVIPTAVSLASTTSTPAVTFTTPSAGFYALSLLSDGTSNVFLNGNLVLTNVAGAATQLIVSGQPPATVAAGSDFGLTITAEDSLGNIATSFTGSVTVALVSASGSNTLGGTLSVSAVGGVATFSGLTLNRVGSGYTLSLASGSLTTATSSAISVTPGVATQLLISPQPSSTVVAGSGFGLTVLAEDADGNLASGYSGNVTVALAANPDGSTLGGTLQVSFSSGVANFSGLTLNKVDSGYKLAVGSSTLTSATSSAISVLPGAATQLLLTTQPPATVAAGGDFGLTIIAEDAEGNLATGYAGDVAVALANNPGNGILSGTLTVAATGGVAVLSGLSLNSGGSGYTLQASSTGLAPATSNSFDVAGPTTLVITGSPNDEVSITFTDATDFTVTIDGTSTSYSTSAIDKVIYNGPSDAFSKVIFYDPQSADDYTATQTLTTTVVTRTDGTTFEFDANNAANLYIYVTDPSSAATSSVTVGTASNYYVLAANGGYSYVADVALGIYSELSGFPSETATGSGGTTYAYVYSTSHGSFDGDPGGSTFTVGGVTSTLSNFPQVYAVGASDGTDNMTLHSEGGKFVGTPSFSYVGGNFNGESFMVATLYAANVTAQATNPTDAAYFYSAAGDTFTGGPTSATMVGSNFQIVASNFGTVIAMGTKGGDAILNDSPGYDQLLAYGSAASLYESNGTELEAQGFADVTANSTAGSDDPVSRGAIDFALTLNGNWY